MLEKNRELKARRALFVEEYLVDFNGTKAAIRAGYAEQSAAQEASRLLRNVKIKEAIEKRKAEILAEISADQFRTAREFSRIAYSDVRQAYTETGELKRPGELDNNTAAAIASVETVRRQCADEKDANGEPVYETVQKIRLWDKLRALEALGKYLGMFADQTPGNTVQVVYMSEKPQKPDDAGTG